MWSLTVHPAAGRELDEALTWCRERFGRRIPDRLLLQFDRAATLLRTHAEIGSADASGARKLPLPRFPYSVIYRIEADGQRIVELALHHQRRKTGIGWGGGSWRMAANGSAAMLQPMRRSSFTPPGRPASSTLTS